MDCMSPVSSIDFVPSFGLFFVNASTAFTISASDAETDVAWIEYNLNGTGWNVYTGPFNLSSVTGDGIVNIYYHAIDIAGNIEVTNDLLVYIGSADPLESTMHFVPASGANLVNNDTGFEITVSTLFGQSIEYTRFRIDGSAWLNYSTPFTLEGYSDGEHVIEYYSTDEYANTENVKNVTVYLDATVPALIGGISLPSGTIVIGTNVTIRVTCDSPGYNVTIVIDIVIAASSISIGTPAPSLISFKQAMIVARMVDLGNGTYQYTWNTASLATGNYSIAITVVDLVGNTNTIQVTAELAAGTSIDILALIIIVGIIAALIFISIGVSKSSKAKKASSGKQPGKKAPSTYKDGGAIDGASVVPPAKGEVLESTKQQTPVPSSKQPPGTKAGEPVPVDIKLVEAKMVEIFKKKSNYVPSKTDLSDVMTKLGFTLLQIELAFDNLRRAGHLVYQPKPPSRGWHYHAEAPSNGKQSAQENAGTKQAKPAGEPAPSRKRDDKAGNV